MTELDATDEHWARSALHSVGARRVAQLELLAGKRAERLVVGAVADGRPVVVKRMSTERRQRSVGAWQRLWDSPFGEHRTPPGLPELVGEVDQLDAIVLERIAGERLAGRHQLDSIGPRVDEVARLLHDFHSAGVVPPVEHDVDGLMQALRSAVERRAPRDASARLIALVDRLDEQRPEDAAVTSVHGDFNPRNVFVAAPGLRLIDLDLLQLADPAVDIGHWSAWCWVAGWHEGAPSWQPGADLLQAYAACGVAVGFMERVAFHEVARLLRISLGSSVIGRHPAIVEDVVRAVEARMEAISGR